jgi:hypothetical protein
MRHSPIVHKLLAVVQSRTKRDPSILMPRLADKFYSKLPTKIIGARIEHQKH